MGSIAYAWYSTPTPNLEYLGFPVPQLHVVVSVMVSSHGEINFGIFVLFTPTLTGTSL
jgi:hypothetical protein